MVETGFNALSSPAHCELGLNTPLAIGELDCGAFGNGVLVVELL
jgi:hypothetical protein